MPKTTITIPCEIGDTIYCVVRFCKNIFETIQTTVCEISIITNNRIIIGTRNARNKRIIYYPVSAFGETVFHNENDADNKCEELNWMCENNEC